MAQTTALEVLRRLQTHPSLGDLQYNQVQRFLELVRCLWPEIVPPQCSRPVILPVAISEFLASVLSLDGSLVQLCWHAFGDLGESFYCNLDQPSIDDSFRIHGQEYQLGWSIYLDLTTQLSYSIYCPRS